MQENNLDDKPTEKQIKQLKKALIKKAMGYSHDEVVEEYVCTDEGEIKLSKRKVTKKFVPPDIPAAKILLGECDQNDYSTMTDEELINEKKRLLAELANFEDEEE